MCEGVEMGLFGVEFVGVILLGVGVGVVVVVVVVVL